MHAQVLKGHNIYKVFLIRFEATVTNLKKEKFYNICVKRVRQVCL